MTYPALRTHASSSAKPMSGVIKGTSVELRILANLFSLYPLQDRKRGRSCSSVVGTDGLKCGTTAAHYTSGVSTLIRILKTIEKVHLIIGNMSALDQSSAHFLVIFFINMVIYMNDRSDYLRFFVSICILTISIYPSKQDTMYCINMNELTRMFNINTSFFAKKNHDAFFRII